MCAPAARHSWRVNTSPPETRTLTASSALAACTPRNARPAANQSQVLEEESTSHLRSASGISHVSPAPSALLHWWAPAFSPTVTGSCAATATPTYKAVIYEILLTLPLTYLSPFATAFQEPQGSGMVTQANKCCLSGRFYIKRSVPRGPCLGPVFIQELVLHCLNEPPQRFPL